MYSPSHVLPSSSRARHAYLVRLRTRTLAPSRLPLLPHHAPRLSRMASSSVRPSARTPGHLSTRPSTRLIRRPRPPAPTFTRFGSTFACALFSDSSTCRQYRGGLTTLSFVRSVLRSTRYSACPAWFVSRFEIDMKFVPLWAALLDWTPRPLVSSHSAHVCSCRPLVLGSGHAWCVRTAADSACGRCRTRNRTLSSSPSPSTRRTRSRT